MPDNYTSPPALERFKADLLYERQSIVHIYNPLLVLSAKEAHPII